MSNSVIAPYALLAGGWARDVRIDIDADGTIAGITPDSPRRAGSLLPGPVIPGMPNVHSHAFQRALAGRLERTASGESTFWTWRSAMYALANALTPDRLEAIAAQAYVEMLEAGYTSVGEFHYVHHDRGGTPFAARSEMAQRLLRASRDAGIAITLLPVFYRWSGFGARPPEREQARFVTSLDGFIEIVEELLPLCAAPDRRLGIAPHSLRAVGAEDLQNLIRALDERDPEAPLHMHVAEQYDEVEACIEHLGMRPVEWLTEHVALSPRWCVVHATHMNREEARSLAAGGAAAGVCPTTEANLGDGIFPLDGWRDAGGAVAIGSDSHVSIDVAEELRWLEYAQRLRARRRTVAPSPEALYVEAARAGARALGQSTGTIAAGRRADFIVLDAAAPMFAGGGLESLVDRFITCGGRRAVRDVYAAGKRVVADGRHIAAEAVAARYRTALAEGAVDGAG